jgi:hypothetical protein
MSSSKGLSEITEKIKRKIKKSHEMNLYIYIYIYLYNKQ